MNELLEFVQKHERSWGNESYTGRPTLAQILAANVVVFWAYSGKSLHSTLGKRASQELPPAREIITLHNDTREIESYLTRLVFFAKDNPPDRKYLRAFVNQRPVKIKSVRIEFDYSDTTPPKK